MNLQEYLAASSVSKADFARRIGVSPAVVYQWSVGLRPVAPKYCHEIEDQTEGKVTRQELRPDDWQLLWPDLSKPKRRSKLASRQA
jgi:DNA-binding transcriptional regulator YdaS (Cro superfamily)